MSILAPPAPTIAPDVPSLPLYRLSVEQYHAMARLGILGDEPVELLHGLLVRKMTRNPPHRLATVLLRDALLAILPESWHLQTQDPISLPDSAPEPDGAVVRGLPRDYAARHPGPSEVALVIEVSDTTLDRDRQVKGRLYAAASIPVYWIVNLEESRLEVYSNPVGSDYTTRQILGPDDAVLVVLDGREIARITVRDLLP